MFITETTNTDTDEKWRDFERTGSIASYLRYKGIITDSTADSPKITSAAGIRDGEPVGNY